ncbi:MAG TPA: glutathione S-transferase family protein [Polyangiales bacterium]|jgi:glutathione S-transferase|nr:glutathione S-transferase family protein [Polyangiales bacterium]
MKLVIGNKNYSSWSLRPWLLLRQAAIPFEEQIVSLYDPATRGKLKEISPSGRVPALIDGEIRVWESLAICEYVAERFPERGLWPSEPGARAYARAVSHEMHAGFGALRSNLPMNVRKRYPAPSEAQGVGTDIARIQEIWQTCRERFGKGGPFLFGQFSVADAMFAPVAFRFQTYSVPLTVAAQSYRDTMLGLAPMREWAESAKTESWVLPQFEK